VVVVTHEAEDEGRSEQDGAEEEECGGWFVEGIVEEGEWGGGYLVCGRSRGKLAVG